MELALTGRWTVAAIVRWAAATIGEGYIYVWQPIGHTPKNSEIIDVGLSSVGSISFDNSYDLLWYSGITIEKINYSQCFCELAQPDLYLMLTVVFPGDSWDWQERKNVLATFF